MSNYNAESVKTINPIEHIRQYPGMYIGSKDIHGLHHCIKEIISNSIDEYLNGAGSNIIIQLLSDGGIYIEDNGRGIPHGKHESGCSILEACFGITNTGGKFDNETGETGYNSSGGQHGLGAKAVNALSKQITVISFSDGIEEIVKFEKGYSVYYNSKKCPENQHGTIVQFYPDESIFETTIVDDDIIEEMVQEFSFLCSGLTFHFTNKKNESKTFYSENGMFDYIEYLNKGKDFLCKPIYLTAQEGKFQVEVIIGYNNSYKSIKKIYTNNIPQEKGTHLTGFKTGFTQTFNTFAREKKWLKEKDENLLGSDLEEGQILIINFKMIDPVFKGQNKEELSSSEGRTYVQRLVANSLKNEFLKHEKDIKKIAEKAINARKAREAAKKARDIARKSINTKKGLKNKLEISSKFIDCKSKDPNERVLLLVEG